MANGVLGKTLSVAGTEVIAYTAPATLDFATISINLVNQAVADAVVKVAVTTSASASPADYIDFNSVLPGNGGGLERTCIVVSPGENVIIESDNSNVAIRVYGLEKLA